VVAVKIAMSRAKFGGDFRLSSSAALGMPKEISGVWRRSPLRPLLDRAATLIDRATLEGIAESVTEVTKAVTDTNAICELSKNIKQRLEENRRPSQALDTSLGFSPTEPTGCYGLCGSSSIRHARHWRSEPGFGEISCTLR